MRKKAMRKSVQPKKVESKIAKIGKVEREVAMRILEGPPRDRLVTTLAERGATDLAGVESVVRRIVNDVRRNGDRAIRRYAARWDGLGKNEPLRVSDGELQQAWEQTDPKLQDAIQHAAGNIRRFAEWQLCQASGEMRDRKDECRKNECRKNEWRREIEPGVTVGQLVRPLESVGCYVPG